MEQPQQRRSVHEIRLYGLHSSITPDSLSTFFSNGVRVLGVKCHPNPPPQELQWAQIWVGTEEDLELCLRLQSTLADSGIILTKAPAEPMLNTPNPVLSGSLPPAFPLTPPSLSHFSSASADALDRQMLQHGPLPRNLYVMGLPLDLTQLQFRNLFSSNGMVEHSALLSQLDGLGRRRGFVLMSTHAEANAAMNAMHGRMIDGFKIDVSWALVQREAKHFTSSPYGSMSNRVVHPPSTPIRREPAVDCSVVVENLDRTYFPSANCIREIFANFGPIARVTILPTDNLEVIIQFEHPVSAAALLNANGLSLGGRSLVTRRFIPTPHSMSQLQPQIPTPPQTAPRAHFDPFAHESDSNIFQRERGILSLLNANSEPFVPPSRMGTRAPTQESDSPSMDDLGSSQSGQASSSSKSKKSHEMRSAPTGLENSRGRDFWHKSTPWSRMH